MDTVPMKTCSKCKQAKPATVEYWHRRKLSKDGLYPSCKVCVLAYESANREHKSAYRKANREKINETKRQYRLKNKQKRNEKDRQYYEVNKRKLNKKSQRYKQLNKEKVSEYNKQYYQLNPDVSRMNESRRRARRKELPATFTSEQWLACLEYHHYCCAVCGNQLRDLFGNVKPHADHWIPLSSDECTGTVADNMICLCNSCNTSKNAKMPLIWLKEKYGTRQANIILARIETYFQWVQSQVENVVPIAS